VKRADRLIDVAAAVGDGCAVDWDRLESAADAAEYEIVRHLRLVERIASVHASLPPLAAFERSLHDSLLHPAATVVVPGGEAPVTWGALAIVRKIGSGTYADVYEARDPRLDRPVALKLLRHREVGAAAESEAIEEARLLARVRHPNVVTVFGAERIDGRVGIWMELVDGQTLEQELRDRGPFGADDLVAVGVALCGALHAVHGAGLLHRDVKAQNVMRDRDGRVLLTDFGTGREAAPVGPARELAGTPLYLAPEVLDGEGASVGGDIYSLGVLLYHLATGSFPVNGRSLRDLRDAHARGARVAVRDLRADLPEHFASTIDRATALRPDERFETPASLELALTSPTATPELIVTISRRRATAVAVFFLVALGLGWWRWPVSETTSTSPHLVLVSAFDNHTGDPRLDDVLQFAFEQELTQSRSLLVVPHERIVDTLRLMRRPSDTRVDSSTAREVCLRDGAIPMLATGRIDRVGDNYALSVAVDDARTGRTIARAGVDAVDLDALLGVVRTLAGRVRTALGEDRSRVEADARLESVTTASLEALRAYTKGMAFVNERRWPAAELPLREAIRLDPSFASAQIMLAHCLRNQQRPEREYVPFAERALQLSENLPPRERYFIAGGYSVMIGDRLRAIAAYEALVRDYPNDFWGLNNLARSYVSVGRYRDEVPLVRQLATMRPHDFISLLENAAALVIDTGDLASARQLVARASPLEPPPGPTAQSYAAWAELFPIFELWADGRVAEAAAQLDALAPKARINEWQAFGIGQMNLSLGRVRAAEDAFEGLPSHDERQALLGYAALTRGDTVAARAALLRATGLIAGSPLPLVTAGFGRSTVVYWSLTRAGLTGEADAFAHRGGFDQDLSQWIRGEVSLAHGDVKAAIPVLEQVRRIVPPGNPQTFIAMEDLAEIFEREGDLRAAEGVLLESEQTRSSAYPNSGSRGYMWLRLRTQLLAIERRLGHTDRAHQIERELRQWLQVADSDFGLLRSLN
jgi:serine/threonine-protein kinase